MKIVLHCSDSSFGNAALITRWHSLPKPQGRGWSNIGYHYVILNGQLASKLFNKNFDGHLETGRPLNDDGIISSNELGAHARGYNNFVGICLIGLSGHFSQNQLKKLFELINLLKEQFKITEIVQHSDLDRKKPYCAGIDPLTIMELNCLIKY